ncbi:MAG: translation initiation factor IF-6 [Candidatus Micrarchaeota archaeon]|nr:translation initiation factor IF-6 [Candidatus Micrarchaeota archaeon]
MPVIKYQIKGSDYVGIFASSSDRHVFLGGSLTHGSKKLLAETLGAEPVDVSVASSDLVGLFTRSNSNGILISNLITDYEIEALRSKGLGINIGVLESDINAVGNNILANDKIAMINPEYDQRAERQIADVLGVEVIRASVGGFKTIGANNILTNKGLAINNRSTEQEKQMADRATGFDSIRTTANTGGLSIGLSSIANSRAAIVGDGTTGYELNRIMSALEIND